MIKRTIKKVYRLINPSFQSIGDDTWGEMDKLSRKSNPLRVNEEKMDETLYILHQIKNSQTVMTGSNEALTRIFTGQKMFVDTRDLSVAPHLMLDGTWEPGITRVFQDTIQENDIVLDIGANFGYFGIIAGSKVGDDGKVFFIEANPDLCPYITKSATLNGMARNSTVSNIAISDERSTVTLNVLKDSWGSSSLMDVEDMSKSDGMTYSVDHTVKVKAETVDEYCKKNSIASADVIKLDIEGYEEQALRGMDMIIKESPNLKLFLEFAPSRYKSPKKLFRTLSNKFSYVYGISDHDGSINELRTYDDFIEHAHNDWLMLLLTKSPR